ncbi:hypothetical protein H0O02_04105 [Candidatus Micrarchaeota archaeon]|nr:hypothetical protein [Candidatus Micrarchaeota archaeon]
MKNRKGQASMELLVTLGIVLAFTIPVIFLIFTITQVGYEDTAKAQADASARTLAETLNFVYSQGEGAKRSIVLNTPPSTESVTVANGEVTIRIKTSEGYYDGVYPTFAKMEGGSSEPITKTGLFTVEAKCNNRGEAAITTEG